MQVWKFGGTSVGKPERMQSIRQLITEDGKPKIVVLSALSGYLFADGTDLLVITELLIGGMLVTAASNGSNQIWERDLDKLTLIFEENNKNFNQDLKQNWNKNCKGNAFCAYDLNKDACVCASQKDDARLQFPNDPNCCDIQCSALPKEKCVKPGDLDIKYYCNVAGKCKEYNATMKDSVIMANICGIDNVTNQYIMPFSSKEECENKSDICNKYNDKNLSAAIVEKGCLNDTNCGMCYNETGVGKCVSGSPAGPNDLDKYYLISF
jgi:hypothetical protein